MSVCRALRAQGTEHCFSKHGPCVKLPVARESLGGGVARCSTPALLRRQIRVAVQLAQSVAQLLQADVSVGVGVDLLEYALQVGRRKVYLKVSQPAPELHHGDLI